jgi:mannose-1-phosphate guanylyltransferase
VARAAHAKPFLRLFEGRSLLRRTFDRIVPLVGRRNVVVVTGKGQAAEVRREAPGVPRANIIEEAIGRNTAASIGIAALWIRARHADGIMIVLPADHWIEPGSVFRAALRRGIDAVTRTDGLLTFGLPVRSPDQGFGYILPSGDRIAPGVERVRAFVEKPGPAMARRMAKDGRYLWNAGIFVWRASTILRALDEHCPAAVEPGRAWARRHARPPWRVGAAVLRRTAAVPIDRAVLERSSAVLVMRAGFRWSDLGSWAAVHDHLPSDRQGNASLGALLALEASGCLGVNPSGLTVFVGVRDVVAVRSGDIMLVCRRQAAQDVRRAVGRLRAARSRYL